ncbi:MAG: hypothetical protein AAF654_04085 [Myxococcota bacterium]
MAASILMWLALSASDSTVVFVGGTGGETPAPTLVQLAERLESADADRTWVVFTGNYTEAGEFPSENSKKRERAEVDVRLHLDAVREFVVRGGHVHFIPGNRDYHDGRGPIRRLQGFINKEVESFVEGAELDPSPMSSADCGDPVVVDLGPNVALALLNSPWWMNDWEGDAKTNQGCAIKSRSEFSEAINGLTKGYRTRRLLIAVHHPLESLGPYGGYFDGVDHLLPPVFGTLAVWARQSGLIPQYRGHVMYDSLASMLRGHAQTFGSYVFVSGHDRSLQQLRVEDQLQLIAGHSGPNPTRVDGPRDGEFTREGAGWVEVRLNDAGEGETVIVDGGSGEVVFRSALPPLPKLAKSDLPPAPPLPAGQVTSKYTKRDVAKTDTLTSWVVGDFYRDSYTLDLEFDVLDIASVDGGLIPVSIGGGSQTNSIRFVSPTGVQWAARATTKDSTRYLPYPFNRVPTLRYFMEEGFTGIHPSAATTVPPLASALGILHTRPELFYLPDQDSIGTFRGFISDEVILLERRPEEPDEGALPPNLGGDLNEFGQVKYDSTMKTLSRVREKPWKRRIAQEEWLRARLLDLFLGDWDRHQDQWRFARIQQADGTELYRPIPRDRDQACAHYDGAFLWVARLALPAIRRLRPFDEEIGDITWLTYNAKPVDAMFMNSIGYARWMEIAREVEAALTDAVIDEGMASWPKSAYDLHGKSIERSLKTRRGQIVEAAEDFFYQVNEAVEILGSEKSDLIEVDYQDDRRVTVRLRRKKTEELYFERSFVPGETEQIRIYALDGKDELVVSGDPHSRIDIRFVGGSQKDEVRAREGRLSAGAIKVYDRDKGLKIDSSISVDDERSSDSYRNQYDFNDPHHEPVRFSAIPTFLFNADDGILLQGSGGLTLAGFKRIPYSASHSLSAAVATTTAGAQLRYRGHFPDTVFSLDQELELFGTTPLYTRNFFGFTSEFIDPNDAPIGRDFYRLRELRLEGRYGLIGRTLSNAMRIGVRGLAEFVDVEATDGRFVVAATDVTAESLQNRFYAGGQAFVELNTLDNSGYPKRGLFAQVAATVRTDVTTGTESQIGTSGLFSAVVGTAIPFDRSQRFVLSTRARVQQIIGDFPFYHAPTLGDADLRAYNDEQLAGNGVFAQSTDLRVEVLRFKTGLPGALGFAASIDHGYAFGSDVVSEDYNVVVGGSVFWSILDLVGLNVAYFRGLDDGSRLTVGIGPLFARTGFVQ